MLVQHVRFHALDRRGGNQLQIGVALLDRFVVLRIAAVIRPRAVEPVLVADLNIMQRKGRRVAVLRALGAPLGVGAAGSIFDLVQRVLDVRLERRPWVHMLLHHRVAGIYRQNRFDLQILAPFQELEQAHAVGRAIVPGAGMSGPIHERSNRLLPLETFGDMVALQVVAAR